ncbi:hypothetical protein TCAL_02392 [Tigriopus californicus]|uniref:Uncharacterized protein n=1 Tax=Tigriopus californicus TaxID=6832 RepID=A0A553P0B2_TIGCA|nr:hypothetical protein TCAL_02392 [Tigriopus californicus]|eukprot:TCALIF_02392-PA protein Name:"Protein of unknown function" AED:0.95 eAED:1.00 QI:0/-1/0/1/-1/1/1/0/263
MAFKDRPSFPELLLPLSNEPCLKENSPSNPKVLAYSEEKEPWEKFQVVLSKKPDHVAHLLFQVSLRILQSNDQRVLFLSKTRFKSVPHPMHRLISLEEARKSPKNPLNRLKMVYPENSMELLQYLAARSCTNDRRPNTPFETIIVNDIASWAETEGDLVKSLALIHNLVRHDSNTCALVSIIPKDDVLSLAFVKNQLKVFANQFWTLDQRDIDAKDTHYPANLRGHPHFSLHCDGSKLAYKFMYLVDQMQYFPLSVQKHKPEC